MILVFATGPDEPVDFSISVNDNYTGEASLCIRVFCSFTVPQSVLDSEPIRRMWFKGDPQNPTDEVPSVDFGISNSGEKECSFQLNNLVQGENDGDYRLKLEWGYGNVHIFNKTVKIIVKGWLYVCCTYSSLLAGKKHSYLYHDLSEYWILICWNPCI